jgi:hypothetical protein
MDTQLEDLVAKNELDLSELQLRQLSNLTPPIKTCGDLLVYTIQELIELCDWNEPTVNQILKAVSKYVMPQSQTVSHLWITIH